MGRRLALLSAAVLGTVSAEACRGDRLPDPGSDTYRDVVSAFYAGLAALEVGADAHAEEKLGQATQLAPREPAAWANLGLLALRRNEFDVAADRLARAAALAPENSSIQLFLALLESNRGRLDAATAHLRRAIELDSTNVKAMYALAQEIERRGAEASGPEIEGWLDRISSLEPDNLAVLVEMTRVAARRGDAAKLGRTVARLTELASSWPTEPREQLDSLRAALSRSDFRRASTQVAFLRNVLLSVAAYRRDLARLQPSAAQVGEPIERFLRLQEPRATPAPPDDSLRFVGELLFPSDTTAWTWSGAVRLRGEGAPAVLVADGRRVQELGGAAIPFPGGPSARGPSADGIAALDFDYDFRMDLALAGPGGFRLFRQAEGGGFVDVTAQTGLPASVTGVPHTSAWAADLDLEGDMDIVLGAPARRPRVLRNNGDGTFTLIRLFESIEGLRGFVWADLDGDGDPDAALLDGTGTLHAFANERGGRFIERPLPPESAAGMIAMAAADADGDGLIDVILLGADGAIRSLAHRPDREWTFRELARWPDFAGAGDGQPAHLFIADLDNNGGLDLIASRSQETRVWLRDARNAHQPLGSAIDAQIFSVAVLAPGEPLALVGLREGRPVVVRVRGTKKYRWTRLRPRAAQVVGDQRINSFGIGGEIELRAGLLFQKQPITRPLVHFGLGDSPAGDVARIAWPNGVVQAEFDLRPEQTVRALQRLKGSCPWVFTYDGSGMRFVTDFIWRSPLGMRINAQATAGVMTTEDWIKIRGEELVPRDGYYDVRITAELWETHFFDHVSLMVVDHPEGTEIFVDERFAVPPPRLAVHTTTKPQPVARAWDDRGREVTDRVRARDERYLDGFGRGAYQGVTRDHWVEVELGDAAPDSGPLWLIASGWIRPTDSSINIALSQGSHDPPRGLRLEVPDGRGGWVTVNEDLGFPAGKSKRVLIDLTGVFQRGTNRRLRLRTNLEVYWDQLAWAAGLPAVEIRTRRIAPETAELRYRGFSDVHEADRSSPEYPTYEKLAGTSAWWRDLIGYYTRFGDVRELLEQVDDRYVIMNAGDELVFRFPAPAAPGDGWARDYVLIGDGWVKDGDYNTAFSKTVRPLPSHDQSDYTTPPGPLHDDPVFRRHARDWQEYHTRYVTPERFREALRPQLRGR